MKRGLIIFIRNPEPGRVKTRLAKTVGDDAALDVYRRLLRHTRHTAEAVSCMRFLFYADQIAPKDEWTGAMFSKHLQSGIDLGERMLHAFELVFEQACGQAIIIGSDCPGIDPALIESAFDKLLDNDVVIGPATDGGYYLLGLKRLHGELFRGKSWSTAAIFAQTVQDIESLGLRCAQLPVLTDVDEENDLPAMQHLL